MLVILFIILSEVTPANEDSAVLIDHGYSLCDDKDALRMIILQKNETIQAMDARIKELELQVNELNHHITENQARLENAERSKGIQDNETRRWKRKYHLSVLMMEEKKREVGSKVLSMEVIKNEPDLVKFYTGFSSYSEFLILQQFLANDLNHLRYWGSKAPATKIPVRRRNRVLSSEDQLLLVLARLRVGLLVEDLAFR